MKECRRIFLQYKVFTITFDQFNPSLLNESINFFQKKKKIILLTPKI